MMPSKLASPTFAVTAAILGGLALAVSTCQGAVIVVDRFEDGGFTTATDQSRVLWAHQQGGMLGGWRTVGVSTSRRRTTVTAQVDAVSSTFQFDSGSGPPLSGTLWQGFTIMQWHPDNPLNLLPFDLFVLQIPSLQGEGRVHVGLNEQGFGTSSTFVPLASPGELRIPIADADLGTGSISGVASLQIVFIASTPDFAFSLDEIRIIPEPGLPVLGSFLLLLFARRRARRTTSPPRS